MTTIHRTALISDVHGNALALRAVLDDAKAWGVDHVVCLGDVATLGPHPREVLQLVRERCTHVILGNHDEFLIRPDTIRDYTEAPPVVAAVSWCRSQLTPDDVTFVSTFAERHTLELGPVRLLLFHGTPASNTTDLLAETPAALVDTMLGAHRATVMAGGHTHVQMLRQHHGTLLLNPGSVGLPFRDFVAGAPPTVMPMAEYAVVEARGATVSVGLRRVMLPREELLAAARTWDQPLGAYLVQQYSRPYPEVDAPT
ncbi:MAG: metallophosphoesterase family protein [Myxococcota bacterium]